MPHRAVARVSCALLAAICLGCGGGTDATRAPTGTATVTGPGGTATSSTAASRGASAGSPVPTDSGFGPPGAPTTGSGASSSPEAPTPTPDVTGSPAPTATLFPIGDAATCTGEPKNQAFFAEVAASVSWSVYCGVLPDGWFVQHGTYELDAGGQMAVTYQGPAGVHIQLQEGVFCAPDATGCAPQDEALGPTSFGDDRTGTLVGLSPGYAIYVDVTPGKPGWAAATVDLDEASFVRLVAALHEVAPQP